MRVVIYTRVSTDAQERDGTSLDTQERACLELAAVRGWSVVRRIRDAASGFHLDREGVEELRGILRRGETEVVLAYAVDRLSRNQNHIGVLFDEVEQAGAVLEFVTEKFEDTAIGRFILAARAFIAEVEREKIAERTMRGKAERARSGRLPQGTGRGIYGYVYDPESGRRAVHPLQAPVVQRAFEEFAGGASCNRIAEGLNAEVVPAFGGGRWYPLTVRRILLNESYTGRTVYRRTKVQKVRDVTRGRWIRRVTERDQDEWIDVDGATPAIVAYAIFQQVQTRLSDPERRRRALPSRTYALSGRIRCADCGSAMVGHAVNRGRYHYYRCSNGSSGPGLKRCQSRYLRIEPVEHAVRSALADLLASPERLLSEARELIAAEVRPSSDLAAILAELDEVESRQRRLIRLFTSGDLPEDLIAAESKVLAERRSALEVARAAAEPRGGHLLDLTQVERNLPRSLGVIRKWLAKSEGDEFDLLLRAVSAQISASRQAIEIRGEVPLIAEAPQSFATIERTSACVFRNDEIATVPFVVRMSCV